MNEQKDLIAEETPNVSTIAEETAPEVEETPVAQVVSTPQAEPEETAEIPALQDWIKYKQLKANNG